MELFYITPRARWKENLDLFTESHYIDLPTPGMILLCAKFANKGHEEQWRRVPGVDCLPHPLEPDIDNARIMPEHARHLEFLGVTTAHRTIQVAAKAAKLHAGMRWTGI